MKYVVSMSGGGLLAFIAIEATGTVGTPLGIPVAIASGLLFAVLLELMWPRSER